MGLIGLKPCPFCDSEAKMNIAKDADGYKLEFYVSCMTCYARTRAFGSEDMAVKAWNHRSGSQTYKEYFNENFPQDAFPNLDRSSICRRSIFGGMDKETLCEIGEGDCEACWNEVMKK